jgi:hypothetical protein
MTEEKRKHDEQEPGDHSRDPEPHHSLNNPADNPDDTEWPDPYDKREDPRGPDQEHPQPGSTSTSEPDPPQDEEAKYFEGPKRDKVDE